MSWSEEEIDFLQKNYPKKGRAWVVKELGKTDGSVRSAASRMGLKARGVSEAWANKQKEHSKLLTGRKRPDQSAVMKKLHSDGKLLKNEEQRKAISVRAKKWIEENGHPRGAQGMTHSEESRKKISVKSKESAAKRTDEDWHKRTVKAARTREKNGTQLPQRINATWKAGWREIGGIKKFYRSRWEANYARYLQWLKEKGQITSWAHEPKTFWFDGIKRGSVSYLPDFHVVEVSGKEAYHEVKGWMDERSATKIKRMAKYHPDVTLIVIRQKQYLEIASKVSAMIEGWE